MAKYTGEDMVLTFKGTNISGSSRALQINEEVTELDVTTYGSPDREYLLTKKRNRDGSFTILDTAGASTIEDLLDVGSSGTLEWSPEGTAVGMRKRTATVLVRRSQKSHPHDDATQFNIDFRLSGSVVKAVHA